jgi:hypothetical protein
MVPGSFLPPGLRTSRARQSICGDMEMRSRTALDLQQWRRIVEHGAEASAPVTLQSFFSAIAAAYLAIVRSQADHDGSVH